MARPIAKDHDDKRAHILAGAARLFAEQGYARSSMSMLAKSCGISKANIYHYYDSKDALLFDMLNTYLRQLRDTVCLSFPDAKAPEDRLRHMIGAVIELYEGADNVHKILINALDSLPSEEQKILRDYQREMIESVSATLREVSPAAYAGNDEKLRMSAMSIFGMLNWYSIWNAGASQNSREAYARFVSDLMLNGIEGR